MCLLTLLSYNFLIDVFLDKEVPVKFWKSFGSGSESQLRILTVDLDQTRLGGALRSLSALVFD